MRHFIQKLTLAAALAAVGAAHADTTAFNVTAGGPPAALPANFHGGWGEWIGNAALTNPMGSGSLAFSELLIGALNIANISVTPVFPAILIDDGGLMSIDASIQSLGGTYDSVTNELSFTKVGTQGGAVMIASALLPNGKKNTASTGGSLSLIDITVDLTTKGIYATLVGGNGIGTRTNQLIWHYDTIEGSTRFALPDSEYWGPPNPIVSNNVLRGLTITTEAFDMFAQSLGLTTFGKASMGGISDYGVITASTSVAVTPVVPEPSTYLQMGIGLVGLAFLARRIRRA